MKLIDNDWITFEYKDTYDSINLLNSLLKLGNEIFKDARQATEIEERSINAYIKRKAKIIKFKTL
jgi:hypothetical protein